MFYTPALRYPARKPTGAKLALKPFHVWGIRVRLQVAHRIRDLALFDLALDSKLRGCDLLRLRVSDLMSPTGVKRRAVILQQKTGRPVQFRMKSRKGVGGRPRHGAEVKKAYLNMRTDPELRARVEASAARHSLSIAQEVERMVRCQLDADAV